MAYRGSDDPSYYFHAYGDKHTMTPENSWVIRYHGTDMIDHIEVGQPPDTMRLYRHSDFLSELEEKGWTTVRGALTQLAVENAVEWFQREIETACSDMRFWRL